MPRMLQRLDSFKIAIANISSWLGTIVSLTLVKDVLQIAAIVASLAVSFASIWWIRRQAKALDAKIAAEAAKAARDTTKLP